MNRDTRTTSFFSIVRMVMVVVVVGVCVVDAVAP